MAQRERTGFGSRGLEVRALPSRPQMRGGGTGTTPGSEPGDPGSNPGLAATDDASAVVLHLDSRVGLLRRWGFLRSVIGRLRVRVPPPGSMPGVAQSAEHQCPPPPWFPGRLDHRSAAKDGLPSWRGAHGQPCARRSTRHRSSALSPDRTVPHTEHAERSTTMSKFSGTRRRPLRANVTAPVRTDGRRTLTHEGGGAHLRDAESELFLLAATNMVGEDTFYERAADRDAPLRRPGPPRHRRPTRPSSPAWRRTCGRRCCMRSAAVVMAAEYVAAGGPVAAPSSAGVLQRPDEPAELLGYWLTTHGRNLPMAGQAGRGRRRPPALQRAGRPALRRPVAPGPHGRRHRADPSRAARRPPVGAVPLAARPSPPRRRRGRRRAAAGAGRRGRPRGGARRRASGGAARPWPGRAGRGRLLVGAAVGLAAGRHGRRGVGRPSSRRWA